jgi:Chalcone isomerase-like
MLAVAVSAHARLPASVATSGYEIEQVGRGELRWLGLAIYEASLWAPQGRFSGFEPGRPVALSLWYKRAFSRDRLIEITLQAWTQLGTVSEAQRVAWGQALRTVWSDVAPGDIVTTVVVPGHATRFYDQHRCLGSIHDPDFGPAFLGIWLDRRSAVATLRAALLGLD